MPAPKPRSIVPEEAMELPNQPPPFEGFNLFDGDVALRDAVTREDAQWAVPQLHAWGATLGSPDTYALADAANRNGPVLRTHDRRGERVDDIVFHPAWHALMRLATEAGEHCAPWRTPQPGAHAARAASYYLHAQVENGTQCPLTMTYASVPVLARHAPRLPAIGDTWLPRVLADEYHPRP
jgi:putative acyl-CoA dehydrogenase